MLLRARQGPLALIWLTSALLVAVVVALVVANNVLGARASDIQELAILLLGSGGVSLVLGLALVRQVAVRSASLRTRITVAFGAGLLVAVANVLATSLLMFLSGHDLALLLLLLAFAAAISLAFGVATARMLSVELEQVSRAADRLAEGNLQSRVRPAGSGEVARLGLAFDRMADRLEGAFQRERALEHARRDLVAAVSHDLRTPLATTRAMVESITDGVVSDEAEVRRYLGLILREVNHLNGLIDDLFELSQIESGAMRLHVRSVLMPELVAETVAAYDARARENDITIQRRMDPALPPALADGVRVQQVLRNLLDNALRHTPGGGTVLVQASAVAGRARLSVSDTGPGVTVEERERVFERFYRGEPSRRRAEEGYPVGTGAGLGLAIAKGLVKAHGGEIWVEDAPGGGAAFCFTLPFLDAGGVALENPV